MDNLEKILVRLTQIDPDIQLQDIQDIFKLALQINPNIPLVLEKPDVTQEQPQQILPDKPVNREDTPSPLSSNNEPVIDDDEDEGDVQNNREIHSFPHGQQTGQGRGASVLRVTDTGFMPGKLDYYKALYPLRQKRVSYNLPLIDEEATAQISADARLIIPLYKGEKTNWIEIILLVEESESMCLWQKEVDSFVNILQTAVSFKRFMINYFHFDVSDNTLSFYKTKKKKGEKPLSFNIAELQSFTGNRIILVISDCVSPAWHQGVIQSQLKLIDKNILFTLIQILPEQLWNRTALGRGNSTRIDNYFSFSPYVSQIRNKKDVSSFIHPVIRLTKESLKTWTAEIIKDVPVLYGCDWPLNREFYDMPGETALPKEKEDHTITAKKLYDNFRINALQLTRRLAASFTIISRNLNLPLLRLVQRLIMPQTSTHHLAEFLFSGLVEKINKEQTLLMDDEIEFRFKPGVKELLESEVNEYEREKAKITFEDSLTGLIRQGANSSLSFRLLVDDPSRLAELRLDQESEAVARMEIEVLRGMVGGEESLPFGNQPIITSAEFGDYIANAAMEKKTNSIEFSLIQKKYLEIIFKSRYNIDIYEKKKLDELIDESGYLFAEGKVIGLSIINAGIKEIPEVIKKFTSLQYLNLSKNKLTILPEFVKGFKELKQLNLINNHFKDISIIAKLINLDMLLISSPNITDIESLANLKKLTYLHLACPRLFDISILGKLTNLKYLSIKSFFADDVTSLRNLKKLSTLNLYLPKIKDISSLSDLECLTHIIIKDTNISDFSLLSKFKNLQSIDLTGNSISDISFLDELLNVTILNLSFNQIKDVTVLSKLVNLYSLDLRNNSISDLSALKDLRNLDELTVENNPLENPPIEIAKMGINTIRNWFSNNISNPLNNDKEILIQLEKLLNVRLKQVESFKYETGEILSNGNLFILSQNHVIGLYIINVKIETFPNLVLSLESLEILIIENCGLTELPVKINRLKKLTHLDLSWNKIQNISPLAGLTQLQTLGLGWTEIHDISPLSNLTQLTELNLGHNQIEDISPLRELPKLKELSLQENRINKLEPWITDFNMEILWVKHNNYRGALNLYGNPIEVPPPIIVKQGKNSVNNYFIEKEMEVIKDIERVIGEKLRKFDGLLFDYRGYTVDENGHIKGLSFFECRIKDITRIIKLLKALPKLTQLKLYANLISDISPLKELPQIIQLDLYNNQIKDITTLKYLAELNTLRLHSNQINDITPLTDLKYLTILELHYNQITDITTLEKLLKLEELYLSGNQITNISPIKNIKTLKKLDLNDNQINDITPLNDLTNLETLYLFNNMLTDITPIQNLKKLHKLDIADNHIDDITPLQNLFQLESLKLYNNEITDLKPIKNLTNIKELDITNNQITDVSIIQELNNLTELNVDRNPIEFPPIQIVKQGIAAIRNYFTGIHNKSINRLFQIANTRYIWTIAHYIIDDSTNEFNDHSIALLNDIAFNHGARDAETYQTEIRGHSAVQLNQKFSFSEIENIKTLNDKNKDNIHISDEIINFLTNERKYFTFADKAIENFENLYVKELDIDVKKLCMLYIKKSIFLPVLMGGQERESENKLLHNAGFHYTKNYLRGFFCGIYDRLDRDPITGYYNYGSGFKSYYNGLIDNSLVFTIGIENYRGQPGYYEDIDAEFDNRFLIGKTNKRIIHMYNTRFMWTIRRLTLFLGNTDRIQERYIARLERIAFSHGASDYQSCKEESLPSEEKPENFISLAEFLLTRNILNCDMQNNNSTYTIAINESIFLPSLPTIRNSAPKVTENKQIHRVGFIYTKNYILGFLYYHIKGYIRNAQTGFFENDKTIGCYYNGYNNNCFTFIVCPMENIKDDAEFDNRMLLIDKSL